MGRDSSIFAPVPLAPTVNQFLGDQAAIAAGSTAKKYYTRTPGSQYGSHSSSTRRAGPALTKSTPLFPKEAPLRSRSDAIHPFHETPASCGSILGPFSQAVCDRPSRETA